MKIIDAGRLIDMIKTATRAGKEIDPEKLIQYIDRNSKEAGDTRKYDKIKTMSIDEVAGWIAKNGHFDGSPWMDWFNKKYCENCPAEQVYVEYWDNYQDCAWCELHDKCKFFPDLDDAPELEMIIKMWLQTKIEETCEKSLDK